MKKELIVKNENRGQRLDIFLNLSFPEYSRNYFSKLIKGGNALVNDKTVKPNYLIKENDLITVEFKEIETIDLQPENIPLDIIFENADAIVISKQAGLIVHPAQSIKNGTLINALLAHFPKINEAVCDRDSEVSNMRPGLVHRLDKDTTGVMIVAKNARAMHSLSRQISNRTATKIYWALCSGWPKNEEGRLVNFLGRNPKNRKEFAEVGENKGRNAISDYKVVRYFTTKNKHKISLIEFNIKTGRTHQIRVQSKLAGFPVLGDSVYFNKESKEVSLNLEAKRQMLHSKSLFIALPTDETQRPFEAPLPEDFKEILAKLIEIS